ncbi:MAG: NAD(+)/NADH kinase [Candidatus Margulisbacteria bacterium]|jgi:NAD+ kinase|nr:NAD(+)/NADH kinase [Candidatus Margulisiibacteriota bacterium]
MTTVQVIYKKEDKLIAGTAAQVVKELKAKGYKVGGQGAKFAVTLGGDGTTLRAARLLAKNGTPILSVHMGGVGFLTEIELRQLSEALALIKRGKYKLDERTMIEAQTAGKTLIALNDLVISKSGIARVIRLEIAGLAEYVADGLIFSTASGSTAYNLSAGGPILAPDAQSLVISAICPHSVSIRPLVIDRPVDVTLTRGKEVYLTADGQQVIALSEGQKIRVQKSKLHARFIRLKEYPFFERVRATFGFGKRN